MLSRRLLDLLSDEELAAVLAHEQAHVRQRHSIVLVAFRAWRAALPGFPVAALAEVRVAGLIEMLADDRAVALTSPDAVVRAISKVGEQGVEYRAAEMLRDRIERIEHPVLVSRERLAFATAGALSTVALPTLMLIAPAF